MKILTGFLVSILSFVLISDFAWADTPSTHGMLLFGKNPIYLSHLPMFHSPHDYQVILKISLAPIEKDSNLDTFLQEYQNSKNYFTVVPERMDLTKVIDGSKKQFSVTLFEGHFERGGRSIGKAIAVIEKIIFAMKLSPHMPKQNRYLFLGEKDDFYVIHLIESQPSYDAVYAVATPEVPIAERTILIANSSWILDPGKQSAAFNDSDIQLSKTIYTEESDLR